MDTSAYKQFVLPFSDPKKKASKVESAAVYAIADFYRNRGGGLLSRQSEEEISFIAKLGYPLWLIPRGGSVLVFDGLDESEYTVTYLETQSALTYLEKLEANLQPRDKFTRFLSDFSSYFSQLPIERQFTLKGLLSSIDFKLDISSYLTETEGKTDGDAALTPTLGENEISAELTEMDKRQTYFRADLDAFSKIIEVINKTASQYLSGIEFQTAAAKDERDAKIKAYEEFIEPQIAKLNKEYKVKTKELATRYDRELVNLDKHIKKTLKVIQKTRSDIRKFEHEAKVQSQQGHQIYERRWKDKAKDSRKDLWDQRKEYRRTEENIKRFGKEKGQALAQLNYELEDKIKVLKQPIATLQEAFEEKNAAFEQETGQLISLQNAMLESIEHSQKQRHTTQDGFEGLGVQAPQFETPSRVYVPFYLVCYQADTARRYRTLSPSTVEEVDLSAKFKGVLGMSKIKDLFTPRFTSLEGIIGKVEVYCRQSSAFEEQVHMLGTQNNLLTDGAFLGGIIGGLSTLRDWGWLSEREISELGSRFAP